MTIFSVRSLSKSFRVPIRGKGFWALFKRQCEKRVALDGISFAVEEGEAVGYIGPNGAGKSTTLKILAGILVPDGGEVQVLGRTPWKHRIATVAQIGVLFGQRTQLWWDLPVIDSFRLFKAIYRIPEGAYRTTFDDLVGRLDLAQLLKVPVRLLSLGQRMRCELAACLLHRPRILFLDEPTIGLDAPSKRAFRRYIRRLSRDEGVTTFLTTHDMHDVEQLCNRVILLNEGRVGFDGRLATLREQLSSEHHLMEELEVAGAYGEPPHVAALSVEQPPLEELLARWYRRP